MSWRLFPRRRPGQAALCALLILLGAFGMTSPGSLPLMGQLDGSSKSGKAPSPAEEEEISSGKVATTAGNCQRTQRRRPHPLPLVRASTDRLLAEHALTRLLSSPTQPLTERARHNGVGGPLRC